MTFIIGNIDTKDNPNGALVANMTIEEKRLHNSVIERCKRMESYRKQHEQKPGCHLDEQGLFLEW